MSNTVGKCSFCERPANEVKYLVSPHGEDGPFICNRCNETVSSAISASGNKKKVEAPKDDVKLKTPKEIRAFLDDFVIDQSKAKMDMAVAVYNHYKRRRMASKATVDVNGVPEEVEIEKSNILLMGPSGTGKTHLARTLARMLGVPFFVADATRLTQAGYVGDDVETLLQGLVQDAQGDVEKAQWGIIFVDEIDKIARKSGRASSGSRDVSGEGVQQALLKLFEGAKVNVPRANKAQFTVYDSVDTTNILFICAGSFAGIEDYIGRRMKKDVKTIGFGSESKKDKIDLTSIYTAVTEDDILDFGIIPELAGRLPVLTTTVELSEDALIRVLTEPKNSIVKQMKALYSLDGITLEFSPDALRAIAKEAGKKPTGARALRGIVEGALRSASYDAPDNPQIQGLLVTAETVAGAPPVYTLRTEQATG
jgi:ATP-dependent Clp protease ATP-binding subunit ClpX